MIADVRKHLERVPFVPFVNPHFRDGHEYSVSTVDHAKSSPRGYRVVVFTDEDATATLGALHINSDQQANGK
jgi:hypothetical protein